MEVIRSIECREVTFVDCAIRRESSLGSDGGWKATDGRTLGENVLHPSAVLQACMLRGNTAKDATRVPDIMMPIERGVGNGRGSAEDFETNFWYVRVVMRTGGSTRVITIVSLCKRSEGSNRFSVGRHAVM